MKSSNVNTYALFLGCIPPLRYPGIEASVKLLLRHFNIRFRDLEEISCCPAPGVVRPLDEALWLTLAARNLSLAEKTGCDLLTMCNGCFFTLSEASRLLKTERELRERVAGSLSLAGLTFKSRAAVYHFIDLLHYRVGIRKIREAVVNPLKDVKVAVHIGCHYLAAHKIRDKPPIIDELVKATGVSIVDYDEYMTCCGAGKGFRSLIPKASIGLTLRKIRSMVKSKAEIVVAICPFCLLQLDRGQVEIRKIFGEAYSVPVLYYGQLLCLALGFHPSKLGLESHEVRVNISRF